MRTGPFTTPPQTVGPYRLIKPLGGGGMGRVYLAKSRVHVVAVKMIRPEFAADPGFRERFAREVATARKVSGIYTAAVVDADTDGPFPWLATAYIPGPSLEDAVRENGPLPLSSLRPLAAGLVEALAAIHAAGIVHRDLKPSNVLLAADGPRVIDFGIARAAEAGQLTEPGYLVGTLGYMSPEQAQGLAVGPASDVFSLGAVLAFAATGQGPFGAGPSDALLYRVAHEAPRLDRVPPELRPLLERCLAKDPEQRPGVAELLARLDGSQIPENWLPQTIADTLPRYAAARVAPATPRQPSPGAAPATGPRRGRHRQRTTWNAPRSGRRSRVITAVAAVAVLTTGIIVSINAVGNRTGAQAAPGKHGGATPAAPASQTASGNQFPCTDTVFDSATNTNHVPVPASVPVDSTPPAVLSKGGVDHSTPVARVPRGQAVKGTCDYFTAGANGYEWFMQVHLAGGGYGYIWIQYLETSVGHQCRDNGVIVKMTGTSKATKLPKTFRNGSAACSLLPLDRAPVTN